MPSLDSCSWFIQRKSEERSIRLCTVLWNESFYTVQLYKLAFSL